MRVCFVKVIEQELNNVLYFTAGNHHKHPFIVNKDRISNLTEKKKLKFDMDIKRERREKERES